MIKKVLSSELLKRFLILFVCVEILCFLALVMNGKIQVATVLVGALSNLTNSERAEQNLSVLAENVLLDQSAQLKANDMAEKGYFAHNSPDGKRPWYWFEQVGYKYSYAGENLAVDFNESEDVVSAWMNSPTHRANIMKGAYTEVGTAIATGTYKGKEAVFVVQHYASPRYKTQTKNTVISTTTEPNKTGEVLGASTSKDEDNITGLPISKKAEYILISVLALLALFAIFFKPILRFFASHYLVSNLLLFTLVVVFAWVLFESYFIKGAEYITSSIDFLPDHTIQEVLK